MSGNPWWREFRGSCSPTLPSLHLERKQMSPSDHSLWRGNSLAPRDEGMVCWDYCLPGRKAGCFDALSRLEMEKRLWCRSVQSHGGYSSSQTWNLFLQSHRVESHVMNQGIGFQENSWYIALFTIALIPLYKQEYAIFPIILRTPSSLNLIKCSVIYSNFYLNSALECL